MPSPNGSLHAEYSASGLASTIARLRDAVRAFRGKRPKYSSLALQWFADQHAQGFGPTANGRGIASEADVAVGALTPEEQKQLRLIVESVADHPGPIVHVGSLLGETIHDICSWKTPGQNVAAVDPDGANPWRMPPAAYLGLVRRVLSGLVNAGAVIPWSASASSFCKSHRGEAPAMVFINFAAQREQINQILNWAIAAGAKAIAGSGYDFANPNVVKVIDDHGGPDVLEGRVWRLRRKAAVSTAAAPYVAAPQAPAHEQPTANLVSIVIPAFNARDFIEPTLTDVSRQLHADWELIVVEDGSEKTVEDVIDEFQRRHPGHRVFYHAKLQNSGVSNTRNVAMRHCRGEFVAFLDADDRWSPDHLQRKIRLLRQSGGDLAYSRVEMFDSDSDQALCIWGPTDEELERFPESMFDRPYIHPSGVVFRRSLIDDAGYFDEELHYGEDYEYWFKAIAAGKRFCFDPKITSRYRKNHETAATTDRLVLCHEGIARVTNRYLSLPGADLAARSAIVANHFLAAGAGHLGYAPSKRNGCRPATAQELLRQAKHFPEVQSDASRYYLLARLAIATRTLPLLRRVFRLKYKKCRV